MRCRWLGWAGLEIEHEGATLAIDPLRDAEAVFAAAGDAAAGIELPELAAPAEGRALAGLVTHLHRDHADAAALAGALADGAPVLLPAAEPVDGTADTALLQARAELDVAGLRLRPVVAWESVTAGPFTITALPAADGTGDPQLSWAIEAGGQRVVHCGDTMFHGWWWRAAELAGPFDAAFLPINGAVVEFPWRRPASPIPAAMTPEDAVVAARSLAAARAVPMHFGAFDLEPYYRSIPDALPRFVSAAETHGVPTAPLEVGGRLEL